jgi:hypothetical protein
MVYTLLFFSSKCSLFHNSNLFGSCIIHILYTSCAKIKKKNNSGAKMLSNICIDGKLDVLTVVYFHIKVRHGIKQRKETSTT